MDFASPRNIQGRTPVASSTDEAEGGVAWSAKRPATLPAALEAHPRSARELQSRGFASTLELVLLYCQCRPSKLDDLIAKRVVDAPQKLPVRTKALIVACSW